ncbi:MAG: amidase, partial [Bryobacteraceae bacterium]
GLMRNPPDRRAFFRYFASLGLATSLLPRTLLAQIEEQAQEHIPMKLTKDMVRNAASVAGLSFTDKQLDRMTEGANLSLGGYDVFRTVAFANSVAPPLYFNPVVPGTRIDRSRKPMRMSKPLKVTRPAHIEDLAYLPVTQLAELIRTKQVSSLELTDMYLGRMKRLNPKLLAVVTVTEELARTQAQEADTEIRSGKYRGPLHGIPWGVKDIISAKGYPTTWGAATFKDRVIDEDATVVRRLHEAGAVLIAKLSTGELALDDVWFGGQTKNPWDLTMGSQGSSAGPASATSAGLVGFSIGTETGGSIVEPAGICGVTGLRPTFGRVSRHGAMTLSWSLDKIGPICRSVEDCALVLAAIQGPDDADLSLVDVPFNWNAKFDISRLRVGYLKAAFQDTKQTPKVEANDRAALDKLRLLGFNLVEVAIPEMTTDMLAIMYGEATAALRDPVEDRPELLVRQDRVARQNGYRLLPAADYLNANRARMLLMIEMAKVFDKVDLYVLPFDYSDYTPNPVASRNTTITNLTGHPCVQVPHGFDEKGNPTALAFVGKLFGEVEMMAAAMAYEQATEWHLKHPKLG